MNYSDVLKNRHFVRIAAILRQLTHGEERYKVPVATLQNDLRTTLGSEFFARDRQPALAAFTAALMAVADASDNAANRYAVEDMEWLVSVFDIDNTDAALATLWLLMAYASAPDDLLTPAETSELTGTAESGWRNRAAAGEIPGAFKKGKQWLIPRSVAIRGQ